MIARNKLYSVLSLAVILLLFMVPLPKSNLWWSEVTNTGHTVLFVFLTLILYRLIKASVRVSNSLSIYSLVLASGLMIGIAIELLQLLAQREASFSDLRRDFYGIMVGISLLAVYNLKSIYDEKLKTVLLLFTGVVFLSLGISSMIRLSWHYVERAEAFPVIADFDADWTSSFVRFSNAGLWQASNPVDVMYPGIYVFEPEPDWSRYRKLHLEIVSSKSHNSSLKLLIYDGSYNQQSSGMFNMKLHLQPGRNDFYVTLSQIKQGPLSRELDIARISGVVLFSNELKDWHQLEVKSIYLE